jgi:hypothetical protein
MFILMIASEQLEITQIQRSALLHALNLLTFFYLIPITSWSGFEATSLDLEAFLSAPETLGQAVKV